MNKYLILFISLLLLTSCASVQPVRDCLIDDPYGFWGGLWHGLIIGFSFIGSLFDNNIAIYAINNNGAWYNFGFVLGVGGILRITFYTKKRK